MTGQGLPHTLSAKARTPSRESQCNVYLKTNHNGTLRIQEVTEVSAKLCKSAWDAFRRYSGDTLKWKKEPLATNPPHHFNTTTSPSFKRGKPNTIQFPMELTHEENSNASKNINVPNHVFQNTSWTQHAPTSRNLSPKLNATKQVNALSFQMGCIVSKL